MKLLFSRRFLPLFACQFFSAFNDNFLKTSLVFLILFGATTDTSALVTLASGIFIAPYFVLSGLGGELADRYDKATVAQWLKGLEMIAAGVAVIGFLSHTLIVLFVALALFGIVGSLFGPIKYGILPDHLRPEELPGGNALIEGATFIAILAGTIAGGLATRGAGDALIVSALVIAFALACWLSALLIPPTGSGAPDLAVTANILRSTAAMLRHLRGDARLWWGSLVTSWFWLVGIVTLSLLPPLIKNAIGGDETTATAYLVIFSVAVGIGSGLAAFIARGRIVLGTTLAGAALMGIFALDLGILLATSGAAPAMQPPLAVFSSAIGLHAALALAGLAIAGGLFIVPAFAAVQTWSGAGFRARTIAAVNVLNAAFMTGATVIVAVLQSYGATLAMLFGGLGVLGLVVAAIIWKTMPATTAEGRLNTSASGP
jgi:acyl-[acyl-carrier-protein]-phospholipid O-acyltransferase/long-chain-fatty-acid--[acyl-carrier-protein] ligase